MDLTLVLVTLLSLALGRTAELSRGPAFTETAEGVVSAGERQVDIRDVRIRGPIDPVKAGSDLLIHRVMHHDARLV